MPSVAMLDLKIIILSEVRQTKTNIMILLICGPLGWLSGKEATCQCKRHWKDLIYLGATKPEHHYH